MNPLKAPFMAIPLTVSLLSFPSVTSQLPLSVSPTEMISLNVPLRVSPLSFFLSVIPCSFPSQSHCARSLSSSPSVSPFSPLPSEQPHTKESVPSELTHSQAPASNPASLHKHFLLCLDRLPQPKTGLEDWSSYSSMDFHTGSQPENQVV